MQVGRENRECARCGCSKSFEWQTSVGHIACLGRRTVERPVGGKNPEALAGQKLEALLTRSTGGQKAKRCAVARFLTVPRIRLAGFGLQALEHDERRFRINGRQAFTGSGDTRSFGSWVKRFGVIIPQGSVATGERIGRYGYRLGRAQE